MNGMNKSEFSAGNGFSLWFAFDCSNKSKIYANKRILNLKNIKYF